MGIRFPSLVLHAKQILKARNKGDVPKGHLPVYVVGEGEGENTKRFVVPISYLTHPSFQDLLRGAAEEFGYDYPMGGLTIPCREKAFIHLTSQLNAS